MNKHRIRGILTAANRGVMPRLRGGFEDGLGIRAGAGFAPRPQSRSDAFFHTRCGQECAYVASSARKPFDRLRKDCGAQETTNENYPPFKELAAAYWTCRVLSCTAQGESGGSSIQEKFEVVSMTHPMLHCDLSTRATCRRSFLGPWCCHVRAA